jgi:hypothetical protein
VLTHINMAALHDRLMAAIDARLGGKPSDDAADLVADETGTA